VLLAESVTLTVKVYVCANAVGLPLELKTPADESEKPAGSAPETIDHEYPAPLPPVAASVVLYGCPLVALGRAVVRIWSAEPVTTSVSACVAVLLAESLTLTVKLYVCADAVGLPLELKKPDDEREKPAGSAPETIDHEYPVPLPPAAASVAL
jgi:hypothetical protein